MGLALLASGILEYANRFTVSNLRDSNALLFLDLVFVLPLAMWSVAVIVRWRKQVWDRESRIHRVWLTAVTCLIMWTLFIGVAAFSDVVRVLAGITYAPLLWLMIAGWPIRGLGNRLKKRAAPVAEEAELDVLRPSWW
jgi:hypothetical protein